MLRPFPRKYETVIEQRTRRGVPTLTILHEGKILLKVPVAGIEKQLEKVEKGIEKLERKNVKP
jgi:hypothetical protein